LALSRERKEQLVAQYSSLLQESKGVVFAEYRGLTNQQLNKLRRSVRDANGAFHIAKLTLLKRAMEEAGYTIPDDLSGVPVGVGFALEDMPSLAKALKEFAKTNELMTIRGGQMGGATMSMAQIEAIADLPSLDVLRAQIIGMLDAPAANLVGILQAGIGQVVNVIHAYVEAQGGGAPAAAAEAPAADEPAAEVEEAAEAEAAPEAEASAEEAPAEESAPEAGEGGEAAE
jgi:large subunit ribosomal protein L10